MTAFDLLLPETSWRCWRKKKIKVRASNRELSTGASSKDQLLWLVWKRPEEHGLACRLSYEPRIFRDEGIVNLS